MQQILIAKGLLGRALMEVFERVTSTGDLTVAEAANAEALHQKLSQGILRLAQTPIFLYGFRTQRVIRYVAASLGNVVLVVAKRNADSASMDKAHVSACPF